MKTTITGIKMKKGAKTARVYLSNGDFFFIADGHTDPIKNGEIRVGTEVR
jgi:hypothetical protein